MTMNQLVLMLNMHFVATERLREISSATFTTDIKALRKYGIVDPTRIELTKKGQFIVTKIKELADDGQSRDFEGCSGYDDQEDDFDWKAEAEQCKAMLKEVYVALNDILELGRKDFHNPKYDEYFRAGNDACRKARRALGLPDEV